MDDCILPKDFYVYLHRKATTGEVFYVGKGKNLRAWKKSRGKHWVNIAKKHGFKVEIVSDGLCEWYAFELEMELIAFYGRNDLKLGTLVNHTDGGDGVCGLVHNNEAKKIMSRLKKGKKLSESHRKNQSIARAGKKLSKRHCDAISMAQQNPQTKDKKRKSILLAYAKPEVKKRHREALKIKKVVCDQTGEIFDTACCAERWLRKNGFPKASNVAIGGCCRGKCKSAYGYTWRYVQ